MSRDTGVIRTPDQRLRVFVSSTLRELSAERRVTRRGIERLSLAPVMFELGARPHPPRSLYRAYLEQSDIFIGIYWESYGWMAPGENVSGLEDEYNLAPDVPMLIYVKSSDNRQERLSRLLERIRGDDRVSYVTFDNADELESLVTADLSTLLAESFDDARRARVSVPLPPDPTTLDTIGPPSPLTRLIGRADELHRCIELLSGGCRLVTIIGPGGVGKSRLAIAAAREMDASFPDGVVFVDLAPIRDPSLVISAIATALSIRDTGGIPLSARVAQALGNRRVLLVLDNVEQVADASTDLSALLDRTSAVMLATSRVLLRIDGEQALRVAPLPSADAIELFLDRVRAVKPDFEITDSNADDIATITTALDNLPLAVELAAARVRVLPPSAMVKRLDHALPLLIGGARNHPERQRTLRATIDWSADLLAEAERDLLFRLGVFRGGFAFDAVEWMCDEIPAEDALNLVEALLDSSLIQEQDAGPSPAFTMLATVREYAQEELARRGDLERCKQRHASFFVDLAARAEPELIGPRQAAWMARLREEFEDIRAAIDHLLETQQGDAVVRMVWPLYWFWWSSGRITQLLSWITAVSEAPYDLDERTRRIAEFYRISGALWVQPDPARIPELEALGDYFVKERDDFAELFTRNSIALLQLQLTPPDVNHAEQNLKRSEQIAEGEGNPFLVAMVLLLRGQAAVASGAITTAVELFDASLIAARKSGDVLSQSAALYHLGWIQVLTGNAETAHDLFVRHLLISSEVGHEEGIALALEGLFAVSAASDDLQHAGRYLGAAEDIRSRKGITGPAIFSYHQALLAQLEASPAADALNAARQAGREATTSAIVEEALS